MTLKASKAILDFEASGLQLTDSYPISVAAILIDDQFNIVDKLPVILIKPCRSWQYWDTFAESDIHKISRQQLMQDGKPPHRAMYNLNRFIGTLPTYADGGHYDEFWLSRLEFEAENRRTFELCTDIFQLIDPSFFDMEDVNYRQIVEYTHKNSRSLIAHNALDDCIMIANTLRTIHKMVSE